MTDQIDETEENPFIRAQTRNSLRTLDSDLEMPRPISVTVARLNTLVERRDTLKPYV